MNDDDKIIRSGPLKGKKIELVPTAGISLFQAIAEEFMSRVFGYEPGDYLITDESSLADFIGGSTLRPSPFHPCAAAA